MLKRDDIYFAGAQFIIHTTLVETYEKLYRNLLETWKKEIICDDDQNAILQIYFVQIYLEYIQNISIKKSLSYL